MCLLEVKEENIVKIGQQILQTKDVDFDEVFPNDEYLYKVMELTRNKAVFLKCMKYILLPFLEEKIKDPSTSQEMIFKLTLHPHDNIRFTILKRADTTLELIKQILENIKDEQINGVRYVAINHEKMDENTLYELTDCNNNEILSLILLSDKVSRRIIKKLQNSEDLEIATMAKVRDPETDASYIENIIKGEIKKNNRVKDDDYINKHRMYGKRPLIINYILEAALKNPKLPGELLELFKHFTRTVALTLVIPHPNVTKELLDYYYKNGDEDVQEAVLARRGEDYIH